MLNRFPGDSTKECDVCHNECEVENEKCRSDDRFCPKNLEMNVYVENVLAGRLSPKSRKE